MSWYKEGLRFACTGCGECCTGSPGYVWIEKEEAQKIADHLHISLEEFLKRHTRLIGERRSLREHPRTYDCTFLKGKRCEIYEARPKQCRSFPWWSENLASEETWKETAQRCEGINHSDAPVVAFKAIQEHLSCHIYLVRHGQTVWNVEKKLQGHLDSPLTPEGEAQAKTLAEHFAALPIAAIYSSPLGRAKQTANFIAHKLSLPIYYREGLKEGAFGILEGCKEEELHATPAFHHFETLPEHQQFTTPMAEGVEARAEIATRALTTLQQIASQHRGEKIVIVSHGAVMRCLKMALTENFNIPHLANGEILSLKADESGVFLLNL